MHLSHGHRQPCSGCSAWSLFSPDSQPQHQETRGSTLVQQLISCISLYEDQFVPLCLVLSKYLLIMCMFKMDNIPQKRMEVQMEHNAPFSPFHTCHRSCFL